MSNTEIINEEPIIDSQPTTSEEEKFFGKTMEVDNTVNDIRVGQIDQDELYSRQTFTYGKNAMNKIKQLNILILGFSGVIIQFLTP